MALDKVSIGKTHCVLQLQTQCLPHLPVLLMTVTGTRENVRHRGSGEHGLQLVVLPLMSFKSVYTYFRTCLFLASQLRSSVGSISSPRKTEILKLLSSFGGVLRPATQEPFSAAPSSSTSLSPTHALASAHRSLTAHHVFCVKVAPSFH